MPFDKERYRGHIAPLKLTKAQEDELLDDLWKITESLVDHSFSSPTYPLLFAIANHAFDAVEEALAVECEDNKKEEETS